MYRQGDILFIEVDGETPATAKVVTDGVIARGEATNHAHRIATEDLTLSKAKVFSEGPQRLFVEAYEAARVIHEEHDEIVLPAGRYEVRRQREYTPGADRPVWH
jgi:hypothetical protein